MNFEKIPKQKIRIKEGDEFTKEQIETLEDMPIVPYEKMELILVKAGLKSATSIELTSDTWRKQEGEESKQVDRNELKDIEGLLKKAGYVCKLTDIEIEKITVIEDHIPEKEIKPEHEIFKERERIFIKIAKNQKDLDEYLKTRKKGSDEGLGEIYGFPQSAIKAYLKSGDENSGLVVGRRDLPEEIREQEWSLFATFMMSKDKWEEELEVVKKWSNTVSRISPKIYKEYVEYMKEVKDF